MWVPKPIGLDLELQRVVESFQEDTKSLMALCRLYPVYCLQGTGCEAQGVTVERLNDRTYAEELANTTLKQWRKVFPTLQILCHSEV